MKSFKVTTPFGTETCTMSASSYADKGAHLAIQLWCDEGPFATMTVNLPAQSRKYAGNFSFVDVNNCPWAPALIKKLSIGKPVAGVYANSGWCSYPLYEFDLVAIAKYTGRED